MEIPIRLVEGSSAVEAKQRGKWLNSEVELPLMAPTKMSHVRLAMFGRGIFLSRTAPETGLCTSTKLGLRERCLN